MESILHQGTGALITITGAVLSLFCQDFPLGSTTVQNRGFIKYNKTQDLQNNNISYVSYQ